MGKIKQFFKESVAELKKVVWPGRDDVVSSVKVVLFSSIVIAVILGLLDWLFVSGMNFIFQAIAMAKGWYILHTYSGYENKIEKTIRLLLEQGELSSDIVLDIKVPVEDVMELKKDGKQRVVSRKFLPGYIMIELDLPDLGWKSTCSVIRRIQGVTGFVGTSSDQKPRPISSEEAKALLQKAGEIKGDKTPRMKQMYSVGETVKVINGPFATFSGQIEEVNAEKNKLKVVVHIFGRATPVEVDLLSVEKVQILRFLYL